MIDGGDRHGKTPLDRAQLAQRQAALVELAGLQPPLGQIADEALNTAWRRIDKRPARAFHGIGEHQHRRLLGLRLGAGVSEEVFVDLAAVGIGRLLRVRGRESTP